MKSSSKIQPGYNIFFLHPPVFRFLQPHFNQPLAKSHAFKFQWFKCTVCTINPLENVRLTEKCVFIFEWNYPELSHPSFLPPTAYFLNIQGAVNRTIITTFANIKKASRLPESVLLPKYGSCLFIYICRLAVRCLAPNATTEKAFRDFWNVRETVKWCQSSYEYSITRYGKRCLAHTLQTLLFFFHFSFRLVFSLSLSVSKRILHAPQAHLWASGIYEPS